jgi:hypothetical protein
LRGSLGIYCIAGSGWFAHEVLLATKRTYTDRWPMKEFLSTDSILAFHGIHDSETTEAYAQLNEQNQKTEGAKK